MKFEEHIRTIQDFPRAGITFRDISPLLRNPMAFQRAIVRLAELSQPRNPDTIVAIDSRGFILGSAVSLALSLPLVLVRKGGKLPGPCLEAKYGLEYGEDTLEIQTDALAAGARALVIDDVLATGGTALATGELIQRMGASVVGYTFLIELGALEGRKRLGDELVGSLIVY